MLAPAPRRFSFLLLLALAGGPLACAPSDSDDVEAGDQEINLGQRTVMSRLTESVAPLRKVTATDETEVGRVFNKTLGETDINFSASTKLDLVGKVARNTLVALGKQTSTRKAMVRSSLAALTRRSDALKLVLRGKTATGANVRPADFDEVVIGMGPQGTAYVQEAMREAVESGLPPRRILSIDIGDKPGGTFANVGDAFFLNSTNRADTGGRAQPGQGDLNFLYDLWGVRDFDPRTWPTAGGIGDVSTVGMDLSGAHALLKTELVSVERLPRTRQSAASLRLTLRDLESGQQFTVESRRLVGATGIGKPEIPIKDPGTVALVAEENAKRIASLKVDPDNAYVPKVQTFTDFINYVGQADEPYRWLVNKNVVVAGGGDSGNVINEFLLRIGPNGAYKFDSAQAGNIEKIYWLGVSFADCQQFIAQARGRYALLEAALNSGRLIPVPARLGAIARNGEGLRIRSSLPDAASGTNAVDGVVYQDASGKFVTANPTIDYVILATGFKSDAYKVFKPILGDVTPEQYAAQLTKIEADVAGFGADGSTQRVAIATQLKSKNGPEDIYFIGPANEVVGGLPGQAELARVNANTVSFFANVARTRTLARLNPPRGPQRESLDALYDNVERIAVSRARTPRVRGEATILPREGTTPARLPEIARIETRAELAKVLRGVDLPGDFQLTLSVTARSGDELAITIPELAKTGEAEIVAQIKKSPRLMELFFGYFAKGSKVKELEIVVASDRTGRASWEIDVLPRLVVRE